MLEDLGGGEGRRACEPEARRKRPTGKGRLAPAGAARQGREQLLATLAAMPGVRLSEFPAEIGISAAQVSALLAKARAEKLVVKQDGGHALKEVGRRVPGAVKTGST